MRCPRRSGEPGNGLAWDRLLEHRFDPRLAPPACWPEVVEHLDHCPGCREHAQAVDPTLIFLDLPEVTVTDADIAEMKLAVRTLRGSSAVQQPSRWQRMVQGVRHGVDDVLAVPRRSPAAWRLAAAAVLALSLSASMVVPSGTLGSGEPLMQAGLTDPTFSVPTVEIEPSLQAGAATEVAWGFDGSSNGSLAPEALTVGAGGWIADSGAEEPVVEDVVSPGARVYSFQAADEKMAVVMVIDPTLDV